MLHALEQAGAEDKKELISLLKTNPADKIERVLRIYKACKADEWTIQLKNRYFEEAINHLEDIAVISRRKVPLRDLAVFLLKRDY